MFTAIGCEVITFLTASFKGTDSRYHCDTENFYREFQEERRRKKSLTVGVRDNPVNFLGVELIDDNKRPNPCAVSKGCRCGLKKSVVVVCARWRAFSYEIFESKIQNTKHILNNF
tara:strand:- start:121 stop:465 length:345 start_codon:yes stop_codon:yes gene_type:complete